MKQSLGLPCSFRLIPIDTICCPSSDDVLNCIVIDLTDVCLRLSFFSSSVSIKTREREKKSEQKSESIYGCALIGLMVESEGKRKQYDMQTTYCNTKQERKNNTKSTFYATH